MNPRWTTTRQLQSNAETARKPMSLMRRQARDAPFVFDNLGQFCSHAHEND